MVKSNTAPVFFADGKYWKRNGNSRVQVIELKCKECGDTRWVRKHRAGDTDLCHRCGLMVTQEKIRKFGYDEKSKHNHIHARRRTAVKMKGNKCAHCEATNLPVHCYCFHHEDPKTKKFNILGRYMKYDDWIEELEKTIMLCLHCHKIHHCGSERLEA